MPYELDKKEKLRNSIGLHKVGIILAILYFIFLLAVTNLFLFYPRAEATITEISGPFPHLYTKNLSGEDVPIYRYLYYCEFIDNNDQKQFGSIFYSKADLLDSKYCNNGVISVFYSKDHMFLSEVYPIGVYDADTFQMLLLDSSLVMILYLFVMCQVKKHRYKKLYGKL